MKIIIELPEKILNDLAKLADKENRSRKNFIENELIKLAEKVKVKPVK